MGWGWWRYWFGTGPYPGRGPWSHLPPWMRPGWILWLRGWYYPYYPPPWPPTPFASKEDEIRYLEDLKKYINEFVIKEIDKRLEELKKQ